MIRWLHISDLHIRDKADWNNFKKELLMKCHDVGKIDLVIVTGDFHNFSDGNDFEMAQSFLQALMQELRLDIAKDLFLIPGNHDGVAYVPDKDLYLAAVQSKPLSMKKQWLDKLMDAFSEYETFVKKIIPNYPVGHPAETHCRTWRNKINFIHCNTAIAADGYTKENQLLDADGLASLNYSDKLPNIILAHNNFLDLHPDVQKRVKDVIRNNSVRAYLCGDRHMESVEQISYENNQNRQIPCIGCYKSAPDATDDYSRFGIIVGEWQRDTASLKGWYWTSGYGFKIDGNITEQKIYMGSFEAAQQTEQREGTPPRYSNVDIVVPEKPFTVYKSSSQEGRWTNAGCVMSIEGDMEVSFVSFSRDEQFIIAASNDGIVKLWELSTGRHVQTFQDSGEKIVTKIEDVVLLPNGRLGILHTVTYDWRRSGKNLRYSEWSIKTGECVRTSFIGGGYGDFTAPHLSDDGTKVIGWSDISTQYDRLSSMIVVSTFEQRELVWYRYNQYAPATAVSRNGRAGIAANLTSAGRYYNEYREETYERTITLSIVSIQENSSMYSPSNPAGYPFEPELRRIDHIALSPNGELAIISGHASDSSPVSMNILSIRQRKYLAHIDTPENSCNDVFISSDNSLALYRNRDSFSIWNLQDERCLETFSHSGMKCINFSEGGNLAISGAKDGTIKIWR